MLHLEVRHFIYNPPIMVTIVLLALAGSIIAAIIGTFWYSPSTPMGKLHAKSVGFDKLSPEEQAQLMEKMKPQMPKMYAAQMLLSLLTSFAVVFIINLSVANGVPLLMAIGFVAFNWLAFMVPIVGSAILWGNTDRSIAWKKFFSDIASHLVIVLAIALMTAGFLWYQYGGM